MAVVPEVVGAFHDTSRVSADRSEMITLSGLPGGTAAGGRGVTGADCCEFADDTPFALATAINLYAVPFVNPEMGHDIGTEGLGTVQLFPGIPTTKIV